MKNVLTIFVGLFLASFANAQSAGESILGYSVDMEGITYQVASGGCTKKSDFSLNFEMDQTVKIQLIRNKPDFCEAYLPYGTTIKFTWAELQIKNNTVVKVNNPTAPLRVLTQF